MVFLDKALVNFRGQNPEHGAHIYFSLREKAGSLSMKIVDYAGRTVRELECKNEPGFQRVDWNLKRFASGLVNSGMYRVILRVDGKELSQPITVELDPDVPASVSILERQVAEPEEQDNGRI